MPWLHVLVIALLCGPVPVFLKKKHNVTDHGIYTYPFSTRLQVPMTSGALNDKMDQNVTYCSANYRVGQVDHEGPKTYMKLYMDGTGCTSAYGASKVQLLVIVEMLSDHTAHFKIIDSNDANRWEVPEWIFERPAQPEMTTKRLMDVFVSDKDQPFSIDLVRRSNGETIFQTQRLVFTDRYLEVSTFLPRNAYVYGLGERMTSLRLKPDTYTLWNTPVSPNLKGRNSYGSHPFYTEVRNGLAHGVVCHRSIPESSRRSLIVLQVSFE